MATRVAAQPATEPVVDTSTWLTRAQACDLMDVAHTTLIALERRGILRPRRRLSDHGQMCVVYDPAELVRVPRKNRRYDINALGEITARAFELFEQGKSLTEIVIELREDLPKIRQMREDWLDGGGSERVLSPEACAELEAIVGPFRGVAELIARVRESVPAKESTS